MLLLRSNEIWMFIGRHNELTVKIAQQKQFLRRSDVSQSNRQALCDFNFWFLFDAIILGCICMPFCQKWGDFQVLFIQLYHCKKSFFFLWLSCFDKI